MNDGDPTRPHRGVPPHDRSGQDRSGQDRSGQDRPPGDTPDPSPFDDLPEIPRVRLVRELGRGGMGLVFEGIQEFLERRVAVKVIAAELLSDEFTERFRREAQILAGLKHANIVTCFDSGLTADGRAYMVMEYVDGPGTLRQWTADRGPMSTNVALNITGRLADALNHAWNLGIIHRDVKPDNVLFQEVDATRATGRRGRFRLTPKLIDLGIARASDRDQLTQAGMIVGTMSTMAPEQIEFPAEVDYRADIYGLGCVLYQALTGYAAFDGPTGLILERKRKFVPDPRSFREIPDGVADLVQRMLAYDRNKRPQSYREIIETCADLSGEPKRSNDTSGLRKRLDDSSFEAPPVPARTRAVDDTANTTPGERPAIAAPRPRAHRGFVVALALVALGAGGWFAWPTVREYLGIGGDDSNGGARFVVDADRELPTVLTKRDSTGKGFDAPPIARSRSAKADPGADPTFAPLFDLERRSLWDDRGDSFVPKIGNESCRLDPEDASLPPNRELVCRLQIREREAIPEFAGLVIALPDATRLFVGIETRRSEDGKLDSARGVVAPLPADPNEIDRMRVARAAADATGWLLRPIADGTSGPRAELELPPRDEYRLEIEDQLAVGPSRLLFVRIRTDATGLKIQIGDERRARDVDVRLPSPLDERGVGIGAIVLEGKAWFFHVQSRPAARPR